LDVLSEIFTKVSDPESSEYGQFLSLEQVTDIIAPSDEALNAIIDWLDQHGISELNIPYSRDVIHFKIPVYLAEELLELISMYLDTKPALNWSDLMDHITFQLIWTNTSTLLEEY